MLRPTGKGLGERRRSVSSKASSISTVEYSSYVTSVQYFDQADFLVGLTTDVRAVPGGPRFIMPCNVRFLSFPIDRL
jgi:hypothetical protein